ncbi:type II secretion system protein [Candidatus Curtissbacteria bacterium]|nr:type II secretion system protein [Candidatus Curtissbacteria bacterium]
MRHQRGFTLIELLVVMGILAVLLAAVLIAINPQRQFAQARDSQRRNDILATLNAVQQYAADNKGVLPAVIPVGLPALDTGDTTFCNAVVPKYVSLLPTDPNNNSGNAYASCAAGQTTGYVISKDANGRLTISATPEVTTTISVTR